MLLKSSSTALEMCLKDGAFLLEHVNAISFSVLVLGHAGEHDWHLTGRPSFHALF